MLQALTAPLLAKILAGLLAAAMAFAGWQWVHIAGYKVIVAESGKDLAALETQLSISHANNAGLQSAIDKQNEAIELAAAESKRKRLAAIEARDKALKDLAAAQVDYARLKKVWPKDCVTAVSQARTELGL